MIWKVQFIQCSFRWVRVYLTLMKPFQSKISKRSWVLRECLERVPENIDAMRELLQYGLRGTDLEALIAIGRGEDDGRYEGQPNLPGLCYNCLSRTMRRKASFSPADLSCVTVMTCTKKASIRLTKKHWKPRDRENVIAEMSSCRKWTSKGARLWSPRALTVMSMCTKQISCVLVVFLGVNRLFLENGQKWMWNYTWLFEKKFVFV